MNPLVERLGWVLVHSLWQFALVALLAGVIARAMRRNSSAARYGVHVVAMGVMVVTSLVTWSLSRDDLASRRASGPGPDAIHSTSPGADAPRLASTTAFEDPTPDDATSIRRAGGVSPPVTETSLNSETTGELTPPTRQEEVALSLRIKVALQPWLTWIVAVWCIGVAVCSLRPLLGWHTLWRLKRVGVSPASDDVLAALRRVSERLRLRRAVSVLQSTLAQVPVVVGYLRPVVLLPVSLMTSLPAEQLEAILAHELAHVRRHDFVVNLLQTLVETFFFYHPAVWWLSHQIRVEREHCCDDLVVESFGNRVEYGRALLAIEELRGRSSVLALGVADGSLLACIRRIVGIGREPIDGSQSWSARMGGGWLGGLVTLVLILGVTCGSIVFSWEKPKELPSSNPFLVKTADGVEVELLGVTTIAANAKPAAGQPADRMIWWRPDGELLKPEPFPGTPLIIAADRNNPRFADWAGVAVRIRGLKPTDDAEGWVVIDGSRESVASGNGDVANGLYEKALSAGPLPGIKSGVVRVGFGTKGGALGPWLTIRPAQANEVDGPIPEELRSTYESTGEMKFREVNGQARLVTGPIDVSKIRASTEGDLIDIDGNAVKGAAFAFVDGEWGWTYPIPLARVAHYRFRLRAYRHWVTFENVSFQPGHKTDVKASIGKTPELRRDPLMAALPNGVRVEFVGLAAMEAEPKTWWKADGSPLNEVPKYGNEMLRVAGQEVRRALLRVHGDKVSYLDVTASGMSSVILAEPPGSGGSFIRIGGQFAFPPGQKTGRFEVGIATQQQSPARFLNAKGERVTFVRRANVARRSGALVVDGVDPGQLLDSNSPRGLIPPTRRQPGALLVDAAEGSEPATVEIGELKTIADGVGEDIEVVSIATPFLKPATVNGRPVMSPEKEAENKVLSQQTQITWRAPNVPKPMNLELVLIDVHGKQHRHTSLGAGLNQKRLPDGSPHWGDSERFFRFDVPISRVAGFEYRVRPYQHWVTFDNVALNPGEMTDVKVKVESAPEPKVDANEARFTDELRLELKRGEAHGGRWFFVDLDRGRIAKPPFAVELDSEKVYAVIQPKEPQLNAWLKREGIDLILRSEAKPLSDDSGRTSQLVLAWMVRTDVRIDVSHPTVELDRRRDGSWTWTTRPSDLVTRFTTRDDRSGFVDQRLQVELRTDLPRLIPFRTVENVVGVCLLEQPDVLKDELRLRIAHVVNATTPLADRRFDGVFVSGKNGPAEPPQRGPNQPAKSPQLEVVPYDKDEAAEFHERVKQVLPNGWTVDRQDRAFEFRGPNGSTEKTKTEEARITLWFSDHSADSSVLNRRDPKLPRIGSFGITRLGEVLLSRNAAAEELWPEIFDELYWLLPVDHVSFAGIVKLPDISDRDSFVLLSHYAGTRIDVRIDDDGNRVLHNESTDGIRRVQKYGLTPQTRFLVLGELPTLATAKTEQDKQRALRHQTQFELMQKGAREYGVRIVTLADYITYLQTLKKAGQADPLPPVKDGNEIQIPRVVPNVNQKAPAASAERSQAEGDLRSNPAAGSGDPRRAQSSKLTVFNSDGSRARFNGVVSASVGFPGEKSRSWHESPTKEGLISLEKLTPGTHWLVAAGDSEQRTTFQITVPTKQPIVEQRLRNVGTFVGDFLTVSATVAGASPDNEVISIEIKNESKEPIPFSEEDISLTMHPGQFRALSPRIRNAVKQPLPQIKVLPGTSQTLTIKWPHWVREGLWQSRLGELIDEPWSILSEPGKIQVRVNLGNHGAVPVFVTSPQTIIKQPAPATGAKLSAVETRILEELERPTSLTIEALNLSDVIALVAKQHRLPIIIDVAALSELNVKQDVLLSRTLKDVKLRNALKIILEDVGGKRLALVVEDDVLKITADKNPEAAEAIKQANPNALQCRLVAVPAAVNDESPDLSKSVAAFARGEDVTFAVELQNVSDRARTLIGVRYDAKGQPRFEGKLAPEVFAPYLFELEFTDAKGQPVPRTSRVFLEPSHRLSGALTHSIDPGKSLVVVLRPSRFHSPMEHRLPPGKYQARVRYHGPTDQDLAFFRSHPANELRAKAWYGEVTSNPVTFTVADEAIEAKRPKLVWGPVKDGLQAAVEFRPFPGAAPTNDPPGIFPTMPQVSTIFHVKNVSDRTIKFVSETGRQLDKVTATDEAGKTKRLEGAFFTGWPILVRWTLKPGEVAELHALTSGIGLLDKPGKYTLRYDINFGSLSRNDDKGDDGFPKEDDWQQVLPTGDMPITIRARAQNDEVQDKPAQRVSQTLEPIEGQVIDSVTGKPIDGATVRFRFGTLREGLSNKERLAELVFRNVGRFTFELPEVAKGRIDLFVERIAEHPDYQTSEPRAVPLHLLFNKEPNHAHDFIRKVELVPGKIVSGQVLDIDGRPAKGITIFSGRNQQGWQNDSAHTTTTDANGRYRLVVRDRERGRVYVIANHAAAVSRAITPEFGEQPVFRLQRGTRLFGRVTDAKGRGVANVVVRADGSDRVPQRYAMTDADGKYSLPPCQYGQYVVQLIDEGRIPELPKEGVRLPDVYLHQLVDLPKTALTEQQLDFKPTESVRMTARYTTSDDQPVSGRSLSLNGVAGKVNWSGRLREVPDQPGLLELRVPRGFEGRIDQNADLGGFLRILRDGPDAKPTSPWSSVKFDNDGVSFHIRSMKTSSITLRATHDGQPVKIAGSVSTPRFADQNAADEAGARLPSAQFRTEVLGQLWFDVHPNIDLLLKLDVPGFKPWQTTLQVAEGENRVIDAPLESAKPID